LLLALRRNQIVLKALNNKDYLIREHLNSFPSKREPMKIVFHGAAREVGRSCIEIKTNGERYLLDAGIKFKEHGFDYPDVMNLPDVDGLFLSHAHLDHTGALPMFEHSRIICPIFCTKLTYELTKILLKDSYKIARIRNLHPAYTKIDLKNVAKEIRFVRYDQEYKHREVKFMYRNAGHIPGSAMVELSAEGKRILYTGDMKLSSTGMMKGAFSDYHEIDVLIIESTYGNRGMPDREDVKNTFLEKVEKVVNAGGSVLIPVFALGRAQEILIILHEKKFKVPVFYDGLLNKVSRKIMESDDNFLNNKKKLEQMISKKAIHVNSAKKRERVLKSPGIFVTTSGMLQGGPVLEYLKELWHDPKNAVFLTGFQCKRTNGRHLYEDHYVYLDGWRTEVKCAVDKFDFSGHADQSELQEFIKKVKPRVLIFQHGDDEEIDAMKAWAEKETACKVYTPTVGDEIEI
jgi:putative mRNA 3-end processing factor